MTRPSGSDLWVLDRVDRKFYHYAAATPWRDGNRSASGSFALAAGCCFLVERAFLHGNIKLKGHEVFSLLRY